MSYQLVELTPEEALAITKELQDVLAKYDCEIGISSTMNIMKRQNGVAAVDAVLSPIQDVRPDTPDTSTDNDQTPEAD